MVSFFSNIDDIDVYGDATAFKRAVIRDKMYPKQDEPIALHTGSPTRYIRSKENIERQADELAQQVRLLFEGIKKEERIAVFSLAPQPLLFKLGAIQKVCDLMKAGATVVDKKPEEAAETAEETKTEE